MIEIVPFVVWIKIIITNTTAQIHNYALVKEKNVLLGMQMHVYCIISYLISTEVLELVCIVFIRFILVRSQGYIHYVYWLITGFLKKHTTNSDNFLTNQITFNMTDELNSKHTTNSNFTFIALNLCSNRL